jgi:type IV pilus assembly protein PilB
MHTSDTRPEHFPFDDLLPALLAEGAISDAALARARARRGSEGEPKSLCHLLMAEGDLAPAAVLAAAHLRFGLATVDLDLVRPSADALGLLPPEIARRLRVLPLARSLDVLEIAVGDPYPSDALQSIQAATGLDVRPLLADEFRLDRALREAFPGVDSIRELLGTAAAGVPDRRLDDPGRAIEEIVRENPVPRTVERILRDGVSFRASDVHIEFFEHFGRVRYRRDGTMIERPERVEPALRTQIVNRIKVLARMNTAQDRVPDNGELQLDVDGRAVHFRVSSTPTIWGEKVALRILEQNDMRLDLGALGMEPVDLQTLRDAAEKRDRMILVTGPTGSGKSTTLYSLLTELNRPSLNIVTVEDPVERRIPGINQVSIQGRGDETDATRLTFAGVMMNLLRQDPDVVMVGEIRDRATVDAAFRMAITGHRVASTLHTTDTAATVVRLRDLGLEPFAVAEAVELIISQRLVRRLCRTCRTDARPDERFAARHRLPGARLARLSAAAGPGCPNCLHTGYSGRVGIYEFLRTTKALRRAIIENHNADELRAAAAAEGLVTLREAGLRLVERGVTSLAEILSQTPDPD